MERLNIIQFHAESWDGRKLGCMKLNPAMADATPNIDKLASEGTMFRNAYSSNPICCPSRANMLSGTYTHTCESWSNFKGLETGMWTYPKGLQKTHEIVLLGKYYDHLTGHHSVMNRIADFLEPLNINSYPVMEADPAQSFKVDSSREPEYHKQDWENAERAINFIKNWEAGDKPFLIHFNPELVHSAFYTNQYWLDKIPEELVDIPEIDTTDHPAEVYQINSKGWRYGFDRETVRTVRRIYFAMCAEADAILGKIARAVEESGLSDSTVIIFSSDHGELALEHQQYYKMSMYEPSVRVPLIMKGPGIKAGQKIDNPVSLVDIAPTICDLGGIEKRQYFDGESLLPLAYGETTHSRNWALANYAGVTSNTMAWMIRKDNYKLIAYEGYPSRLFNLINDPGELNDIIDQEPEKAQELLQILDAEIDRKEEVSNWTAWRKHNFAQFQRQAKRGLYEDDSYALRSNPSSDYKDLVNNAMTGWTDEDEARVNAWVSS